jgi:hypothetical protein
MWVVFFAWAWRLPAGVWTRVIPGFDLAEAAFGASSDGRIRLDMLLFLALLTALTAAGLAILRNWDRLQEPVLQQWLCSVAVAVGVFFVLAYCEDMYNVVQPWYNPQVIMTNPSSVPVFGQRLLFIWPAMLLKHLMPGIGYVTAFIAFQLVALAIAVYLTGVWSAIFIGKPLQFLGQIILAVMLGATFNGFLGHDFGVVASYTLCFLLLYRRQYAFYVPAFCVGVLNHQNILVLVPTALVVMWDRERRSTTLWVAALTLAGYFSIQFILNLTVPIPATHEIKVWWNIRQIVELKKTLVMGQLALLPWYLAALAAWRQADPFLKRASVLMPMQWGVYFLFGQLNEVRLFNGFLPVLIGILLCYIRSYAGPSRDTAENGWTLAASKVTAR